MSEKFAPISDERLKVLIGAVEQNIGKDCAEWDDTYAAIMGLAQHRQAVEDGRVVELPCKIGAKIFEANQHMGKVFQRLASKEDMLTKIVSGWGKRYFATPEEAEAAILKEGKG